VKAASANLKNLLVGPNQANELIMADLYMFTLADSTALYWTSFDEDITYGGNTYLSFHTGVSGAVIRRGPITERAGIETSPLQVYVASNALIDLGLTVHQAIVAGLFNGATLTLYRVFWKVNPTRYAPPLNPDGSVARNSDGSYNATDAVNKFTGWVSTCEVGRSLCVITVASLFEKLNIPLPWTVLQPSCRWPLFSPGCGLNAAAYANTCIVVPGSTQKVVNHSIFGTYTGTYAPGYFALGKIQFTGNNIITGKPGANDGLYRTIQVGDIAGVTRSFSDLVLGLSPIGYWRLGDAAGLGVAESSVPGGNNGTIYGGVTMGAAGGLTGDGSTAALFDGSSGYITLPMPVIPEPPPSLPGQPPEPPTGQTTLANASAGISFSFLFKLLSSPAPVQPLGIFDTSPGTINTLRNYNPPGPGPGFEWRNNRPTVPFAQPTPGVWHLGCVVFRGQNVVDVFLDGAFVSSITAQGPGAIDWANPMVIGAATQLNGTGLISGGTIGSLGWFSGYLQEFAVYNQALDESLVAALWQSMQTAPATSFAELVLVRPLPNIPQPGDTFTAWPGCDKIMATCKNRYNNLINFGGMPYAPQPDSVI